MEAQTLGRTLINGWLRVVRTPVDAAVGVLPGGERGLRASAASFVDRADASAREHLGRLLHDQELRADGRRRQIAAHEGRHAAGLEDQADALSSEGDALAASDEADRLAKAAGAAKAARRQTG